MKRFVEFLEENNAWENFERAFKSYGRDVKDYKKECESFKAIELRSAFAWFKTEEGHAYWSRLNRKWVEESDKLRRELLSDD